MSFDLRIQFLGLAMYVPEGSDTMHVLLPATEHHSCGGGDLRNGGVEPHFARLVYDEAYERPGQTQLSRRYRMIDLERRVMDLRGLPTSEALEMHLTDELPSLDAVAGPVPRSLVQGMPGGRLAGRVALDSGALSHYTLGATFHLDDETRSQRMTTQTEWTVRGITSRVPEAEGAWEVLQAAPLQGPAEGEAQPLPRLYPIGQNIQLMVFNAIASELPPDGPMFRIERAPGDAEHFGAYYDICPPREGSGFIPTSAEPVLVQVQVQGATVEPWGGQLPGFLCVHARGTLEPAGR
jgi:hypothetical protein